MDLFPAKISKVRLFGLKSCLQEVVGLLHSFGETHVKQLDSRFLGAGQPLPSLNELASELVRLKAVSRSLVPVPVSVKQVKMDLGSLLEECRRVSSDARLNELFSRRDSLKGRHKLLVEERKRLDFFRSFDLDFSSLNSSLLVFFGGRIPLAKASLVRPRIHHLTSRFEVVQKALGAQAVFLIAVDRSVHSAVLRELQSVGFSEEPLPSGKGHPSDLLAGIRQQLAELELQENSFQQERMAVSREYYPKVMYLIELLEMEKQRAEVPLKFGSMNDFFALEAYVREKDVARLTSMLSSRFGSRVSVQVFSSEELERLHEVPPTHLLNAPLLGPYEFLTKMMNLPQSNELDPTLIFAVMFPLFYGIMMGDAGYGLISLLLAFLLMRVASKDGLLYPISVIWAWGAVPTILFGFVYDEFFGFPHHKLLELFGFHGIEFYHGFERMESLTLLLPSFIVLGLLVVMLGFVLGALNAWREGHVHHAAAKLNWVFLLGSGAVLISSIFLPSLDSVLVLGSGAVFLVSLVLLVFLEGMMGLIEIPSVAGNILSFSRMLAVGLASVIVAIVINKLLLPSLDQGILILFFLPLYVFGHLFNVGIGMFESLVQGARLNFIEFYGKFFRGSGKPFMRFREERRFTKA
ncbi:MAG: hypothetical protein HY917_00500 [Candidatus Diapherotrites archaeon]|nr:hypothetical protein [Candidatus Diapherotrites archaeon]